MAKQDTGPVEIGGKMDYQEHDKTYALFIAAFKYGTLVCVALLIAMAVGFYATGFFGGIVAFIIAYIIGNFIMKAIL